MGPKYGKNKWNGSCGCHQIESVTGILRENSCDQTYKNISNICQTFHKQKLCLIDLVRRKSIIGSLYGARVRHMVIHLAWMG